MKLGNRELLPSLGENTARLISCQELIETEVANNATRCGNFAGPKAMLTADVPQEDLRRIGDIECPCFYMNYNLNPQVGALEGSDQPRHPRYKGDGIHHFPPRDLWVYHLRDVSTNCAVKASPHGGCDDRLGIAVIWR